MGINNNIKIADLTPKLQEMLDNYHSNVTTKVKALAKETAIDLTKKTRKDAPRKTGEYKKHISYTKTKETNTTAVYIWYVKAPEYRLTHLLAHGHKHVVGTGKGNKVPREVGRIEGNSFLSKNVIVAERKFVKGVEEIIENGH